uniref:Ig-like domain-containing protein n=1 Tax=Stegastes partitus TaxID=144197 RepID=A0A3B5ARU1_9TELE
MDADNCCTLRENFIPPTGVTLSMDSEVTENQTVTISCTAESFPLSCFTVTRQGSSQSLPSDGKFCPRVNDPNIFRHTFTASSTDAGSYSCEASNTEGRKPSQQRKLVVKYTPKDVKVEPEPGRVVRENSPFKLDCRARSHPEVTSVTWMKVTDGRTETFSVSQKTFVVMSAGPSDSGFYSCMARNDIGAGKSEQVEVEVECEYADALFAVYG